MVRTVVAVVEERNVPAVRDRLEEVKQRAGALGELERADDFVVDAARVAAHHVADVLLREFVVRKVNRANPRRRKLLHDLARLLAVLHGDADEHVGPVGIEVAIVEFGHGTLADFADEALERAAYLGNAAFKDRLAPLADLCLLRHEPYAVEVHVRAGNDTGVGFAGRTLPNGIFLRAGKRERARRLADRARRLENVLDGRARLVRRHAHNAVEKTPAEVERDLPRLLYRHTVGEKPHLRKFHATARLDGTVHAVGVDRLHAVHLHGRADGLDIDRDAGGETAATDRHEHGVERAGTLAENLHRHGALSGDHVWVVVWRDERVVLLLHEMRRGGSRVGIRVAREHDGRAQALHGRNFDLRRRDGHHDRRLAAETLCAERHALCVVARRRSQHALLKRRARQLRHRVVRAAELEGMDALEILAFEEKGVAKFLRERRRLFKRRFDRHIVHLRVEDAAEIVVLKRLVVHRHAHRVRHPGPSSSRRAGPPRATRSSA